MSYSHMKNESKSTLSITVYSTSTKTKFERTSFYNIFFNPLLTGMFWFQMFETRIFQMCKHNASGYLPTLATAKCYAPDHLALVRRITITKNLVPDGWYCHHWMWILSPSINELIMNILIFFSFSELQMNHKHPKV